MNISKRKQGILAIICTIAMIVTSITMYNPREVKADTDYSKLTYNYKNKGEAYMKGSETTKSPWRVAIDESQSKGDIVDWMTNGAGHLDFYGEMYMRVVWYANYSDATLEINGVKVEEGKEGVQTFHPLEIHVNAKNWINNNAYNVVKVTSKDGSQYVTFIVATGDKAGTSSEETTVAQKPSAPTQIYANINALQTDYTVGVVQEVAGATGYKFYVNGKFAKEIAKNQVITIEEMEKSYGLKRGEVNKFGISAFNSKGESAITTIDVPVPEKKEETTTPTPEYKDGEVLLNEANKTEEVPPYQGGLEYQKEYKNTGIRFVKGKKYVAEVVVSSTAAKKIGLVFQRNGEKDGDWRFVNDANAIHYVNIAAGNKVKITYVFESNMSVDDGVFDIYLGIAADATTMVFESKKLTTYNEVPEGVKTGVEVIPSQTKYTVTEDGVAKEVTEGSSYTFGKNAQGYYDATNGVAYAPEEVITVDRNITVTGIKLNVAMESGAGIKLTTPTGLRFKTNVTGTTDILSHSNIIKTGTIITASDILDGGTVDDDFVNSNKLKLNIENENNGWYGNTAGTFCASIVELQEANYARDFVGVGYVTITYNNNAKKTIYAPNGTVRAVATVAQNIMNSKAIYQDGMTYYNYLESLNKGYDTIIKTYAAAKKNNQ